VLVAAGAGAVLALHAVRPDLEPASHRLSEYAVGPWGWLMTAAFLALAAGMWLLRRALPAAGRLRPVRALLAVAAVGLVLSALFRTDVTTPDALRETVHTVASSSALLSLVAAAAWTITLGARAIAWRRARVPAGVATAVCVLGVALSPVAHDGPWTGVVQRLSYLCLTVWMLLVCRAIAAGAPARDVPGPAPSRAHHPGAW
jgi:hypothetical protein